MWTRLRCSGIRQRHPLGTSLRWAGVYLLLQSIAAGWWVQAETVIAWLLLSVGCRLCAMDIDPRRTR